MDYPEELLEKIISYYRDRTGDNYFDLKIKVEACEIINQKPTMVVWHPWESFKGEPDMLKVTIQEGELAIRLSDYTSFKEWLFPEVDELINRIASDNWDPLKEPIHDHDYVIAFLTDENGIPNKLQLTWQCCYCH